MQTNRVFLFRVWAASALMSSVWKRNIQWNNFAVYGRCIVWVKEAQCHQLSNIEFHFQMSRDEMEQWQHRRPLSNCQSMFRLCFDGVSLVLLFFRKSCKQITEKRRNASLVMLKICLLGIFGTIFCCFHRFFWIKLADNRLHEQNIQMEWKRSVPERERLYVFFSKILLLFLIARNFQVLNSKLTSNQPQIVKKNCQIVNIFGQSYFFCSISWVHCGEQTILVIVNKKYEVIVQFVISKRHSPSLSAHFTHFLVLSLRFTAASAEALHNANTSFGWSKWAFAFVQYNKISCI